MTSNILDPIATALTSLAAGLSDVQSAHKWVLRDTDTRPAAVVELPMVERTPVDHREDHLGANDWRSEWTVAFYIDFDANQSRGQDLACSIAEAWITAVDANPTLSGNVQEAKVLTVGPAEIHEEASRAYLIYPTRVQILDFV